MDGCVDRVFSVLFSVYCSVYCSVYVDTYLRSHPTIQYTVYSIVTGTVLVYSYIQGYCTMETMDLMMIDMIE